MKSTAEIAAAFLDRLDERPVGAVFPALDEERLGGALPEDGAAAIDVVRRLARVVGPGLVASPGPRYFGFVTGGALPAALAADWLTSAWDQNASLHVMSPAAAAVENVAAGWVLDLLGLPAESSVGFTTGATMANFTALAAARHAVLARLGWDVEEAGLVGAPPITVVVGDEVHASVLAALQMLGLGRGRVRRVAVDAQGRLRVDALRDVLADVAGPLVVCAQVGNVNSGAFDPIGTIAPLVHARPGWLHVDGAFGLWAAAVPALRHLTDGVAHADSWATDAHKWLNVPYDCGLVMVRDRAAHRAAMTVGAAYLTTAGERERDGSSWVPELSRRARGFTVYAALAALGRRGVADLVARSCALAGRMAARLRERGAPHVTIANDVVLNQVVVRFAARPGGDPDRLAREVIRRVQADGTCWAGGTTWQGRAAMRLSVSGWSTTEDDVDRSADAIVRCVSATLHERQREKERA